MYRVKPPCGKICEKRRPGCQNPETCEKWRIYEETKTKESQESWKAIKAEIDVHHVRGNVKKRAFYMRGPN